MIYYLSKTWTNADDIDQQKINLGTKSSFLKCCYRVDDIDALEGQCGFVQCLLECHTDHSGMLRRLMEKLTVLS